jgi:hypothetical protein
MVPDAGVPRHIDPETGSAGGGINRAGTAVDARMPNQQMQEKIATLRAQRAAAAGQPVPTLQQNPAMLGTPEAAEATDQAGAFLRDKARRAG